MKLPRCTPLLVATALLLAAPIAVAPAQAASDSSCEGQLTLKPRWALTPSTDSVFDGAIENIETVGDCTPDQKTGYALGWSATRADGTVQGTVDLTLECGSVSGLGGARFGPGSVVGVLHFVGGSDGYSTCDKSPIAENDARMEVRAKSWGYLAAKRSGSKVHLTVRGLRYWTSTATNGAWAGASGVIQYRDAGSSEWTSLKNVSTDNSGHDSYVYTTSAPRSYRVLFPNDTNVWGSVSEASGAH